MKAENNLSNRQNKGFLQTIAELNGKGALILIGVLLLTVVVVSIDNPGRNKVDALPSYAESSALIADDDLREALTVAQANPSASNDNEDEEEESEEDILRGDLLFNEYGLDSCEVNKGSTVGRTVNANEDLLTTVELDLPMFEWLNAVSVDGTDDSPFTPPCILDLNEDKIGEVDWTEQYAINSKLLLGSGTDVTDFPVQANGAVCLYNDFRNYRFAGGLGQQSIDPEEFVEQFDIQYSQEDKEEAVDNILQKFIGFFGGGDEEARAANPNDFQYDVDKCTGVREIDSLYSGDEINTTEHVINSEGIDVTEEITDLVLPLLKRGMGVAYEEQAYKLNAMAYTCEQVEHRDNAGIKITATKKYYNQPNLSEEELEALREPGAVFETDQQPVRTEEYELYFPWVYQINKTYRRLAEYHSDFSFDNKKDLTGELFYGLFDDAVDQVREGDLESEIGAGSFAPKPPLEQVDTLLKDPSNLFYCRDIDQFADYLGEELPNNSQAQELVDLIDNTDCVNNQRCQEGNAQVNRNDEWLLYLCSEGAVQQDLCQGLGNDFEFDLQSRLEERCIPRTDEDAIIEIEELDAETNDEEDDSVEFDNGEEGPIEDIDTVNGEIDLVPPVNCTAITSSYSAGHPGVDCGLTVGTPLRAVADGVVLYADITTPASRDRYTLWNTPQANSQGIGGGYGNVVLIKHSDNLYSLYAHMSEISTEPGVRIEQGEVIGLSGNTGNSTGPHIHFELRQKERGLPYSSFSPNDPADAGNYLDPTCLFRGPDGCSFPSDGSLTYSPGLEGGVIDYCTIDFEYNEEIESSLITDGNGFMFSDGDTYAARVNNMCGFDFDSTEYTQDKACRIARHYGCISDNVLLNRGTLTIDQVRQRQLDRAQNIKDIFTFVQAEELRALYSCIWFAESGSGFGTSRRLLLNCGVYCGDTEPLNFRGYLGCAARQRFPGGEPANHCILSSKEQCQFDPSEPGVYMEQCYGPSSDDNYGFADKVARCMDTVIGFDRIDENGDPVSASSQCNLFPYEQNPYGWLPYANVDEDSLPTCVEQGDIEEVNQIYSICQN